MVLAVVAFGTVAGSCGGGGGGGGGPPGSLGGSGIPGAPQTSQGCDGSCAQESLSADQVRTVLAQAVAEANVYGELATVAVVDRVGNVLAVFQMTGAKLTTIIRSGKGILVGLDGRTVSSALAAISKAGTAVFLSSQGNAFTTRTASQIIQEHFNPREKLQPGGPLFGVQFSQLPCGDLVRRRGVNANEGPKRMPLGFSADPGGVPLYINGVPVGGVGVEFDETYTFDPDTSDIDVDLEERAAVAASRGFEAPEDRLADRISVLGKFLRFVDDPAVQSPPATSLATTLPAGGALASVTDFYDASGGVLAGAELLTDASGIVDASGGVPGSGYDGSGQPAEILVDFNGVPFPAANPRDSTSPLPAAGGLTSAEVRTIVIEALKVAERSRAQIRRPAGSSARVNISVVDLEGQLLGFARSPDAPVFGIDVSLQKARTAAFFSRTDAADELNAVPLVDPNSSFQAMQIRQYVTDLRVFLGDPSALANGIAFSDRAGGNLSRPFFPDGIDGTSNGPLSQPAAVFSPFNTGLQLDLVVDNIIPSLGDTAIRSCPAAGLGELANGIQIFPGSVPIFKNGVLVGGIGISGDGVDQDDLVAFLGLHNAGQILGTVGNASPSIRADTISVNSVHLRFVSCPPSPFLFSQAQNVCDGL